MENRSVPPSSAGERKVTEYLDRMTNGEPAHTVLEGLPSAFRSAIESRLPSVNVENEQGAHEAAVEIPPQYRGVRSEAVEIMWTIPEYADIQKTNEEERRRDRALAHLRQQEAREQAIADRRADDAKKVEALRREMGATAPVQETKSSVPEPSRPAQSPAMPVEKRKKLGTWPASYELAKQAIAEGIDLSTLSREDYAQYAIRNSCPIDDSQLRMAPWQRMGTSAEGIVALNKQRKATIAPEADLAFAQFDRAMKHKASSDDRTLQEGVRVRQGTKDSNSWLFFAINGGLDDTGDETYKSYISIKDLNTFTPERFTRFMAALQEAGYHGDIKTFQDLVEQGLRLNDQIVMHGASQEDALLGLHVAEAFFGTDLDQKSVGRDAVVDGKNLSYSQILAQHIRDTIHQSSAT